MDDIEDAFVKALREKGLSDRMMERALKDEDLPKELVGQLQIHIDHQDLSVISKFHGHRLVITKHALVRFIERWPDDQYPTNKPIETLRRMLRKTVPETIEQTAMWNGRRGITKPERPSVEHWRNVRTGWRFTTEFPASHLNQRILLSCFKIERGW